MGMARSVRFLASSAIGALFTVSYSISREMAGPVPAVYRRKETQKGEGGREL
jgi:orotate phosphoribosyltransferase